MEDKSVQEIGDLLRSIGSCDGKAWQACAGLDRGYLHLRRFRNPILIRNIDVDGCDWAKPQVRRCSVTEGVLRGHTISQEDEMHSAPAISLSQCQRRPRC